MPKDNKLFWERYNAKTRTGGKKNHPGKQNHMYLSMSNRMIE